MSADASRVVPPPPPVAADDAMSAATAEAVHRLYDLTSRPTGRLVGLADDLLAWCVSRGVELDWQGHACRVRVGGGGWAELPRPPLGKSAFRGLLARLAVLVAEQTRLDPDFYGGGGNLHPPADPTRWCQVWFLNTTADQSLRLVPRPG